MACSFFFVLKTFRIKYHNVYFICVERSGNFFFSSILIPQAETVEARETVFSKLLKTPDRNKAAVRTSRNVLDRSVDGFAGQSNLLFERKSTPLCGPSRPLAPRSAKERSGARRGK